eukprot:g22733.t1
MGDELSDDELLEIQVLGLAGEGLTLSVPASLTGAQLRQRVRQRLPSKAGARVSLQTGARMLCAKTTLREQGGKAMEEGLEAGVLVVLLGGCGHLNLEVRVALVTEEGLWVGEQRGRRSSLEIELPAGNYQMILEEMMPLSPAPAGCMAMGVAVSLVPFSVIERPATTGATPSLPSAPSFLGAALGLGAACDALGAKPLPLERGAATEVVLEDGNHQPIAPAESHIMGVGQAASYILEAGGALPGAQKREPNASVCELRDLVEQLHAVGDSAVASAEGRVVVGGGAAATLALQLAEETLVEVEVQFNFLLSNVHLWLQTPGAGRSRAVRAPRVRALGLASAVRNARAVLRLRLHPGEHVVNFRHDPAFPKDAGPIKLVVAGGQCAPLALKLRRLRLPNARPVATAPMAPLAAGSDLVLRFALGHSTSRDGTEEALDAELGTAQFPVRPKASSAVGGNGGFVTVAWPSDVLEQVSQNSGNGEIWVALYRGKSGKPWAGGTAPPVSAPPVLWPADDREKAATALVGLGQTMPSTPQLAVSAPAPAAGFVSTRMLSWFVVLGLIVFYYLHSRPWQLLALMRRVQELGLFTRSEHVGGFASFEASSEMTNPWSWPAGTPSVIGTSGATARPARMYGTLDY